MDQKPPIYKQQTFSHICPGSFTYPSHTSSVSSVLLSTTYTILLVIQVIGADSANSDDGYKYAAYLHQSYKWFTYCNKNAICVPNGQVLILKAYKTYKKIVDPVSIILLLRRVKS